MTYGTEQGANQFHEDAGNAAWAAIEAEARSTLRKRASLILDAMFEAEFLGIRTNGHNQQNSWPRVGQAVSALGISPEEVPRAVEMATYELAFLVHTNPSAFSAVYEPGRLVKRKTTGPLTTEYAIPTELGGSMGLPDIPLLRGWLHGLLRDKDAPKRMVMPVMVV